MANLKIFMGTGGALNGHKNANPHYACIAGVWLHSKNYEYEALSDLKKNVTKNAFEIFYLIR